jgi:ubiquinone/menaquinone biosynthesis C-methylase UbiE
VKRENAQIATRNSDYFETNCAVSEYIREDDLRPLETTLIRQFFPPPPCRVLDIGCGAGRTTIGFARQEYRVVGVDISAALLKQAVGRHGGLDFYRVDATRLAFRDHCFDAVMFSFNGIDGLYPVSKRVEAMRETFRVLKPGGIFVFSSHNLIGSIFSGGYMYIEGYWNAAKFLGRQLSNPVVREWYIRYEEDEGGPQFLYSAPPGCTVRQLGSVGFIVLAVRGNYENASRRRVTLREQHVHFVAQKPT